MRRNGDAKQKNWLLREMALEFGGYAFAFVVPPVATAAVIPFATSFQGLAAMVILLGTFIVSLTAASFVAAGMKHRAHEGREKRLRGD